MTFEHIKAQSEASQTFPDLQELGMWVLIMSSCVQQMYCWEVIYNCAAVNAVATS